MWPEATNQVAHKTSSLEPSRHDVRIMNDAASVTGMGNERYNDNWPPTDELAR